MVYQWLERKTPESDYSIVTRKSFGCKAVTQIGDFWAFLLLRWGVFVTLAGTGRRLPPGFTAGTLRSGTKTVSTRRSFLHWRDFNDLVVARDLAIFANTDFGATRSNNATSKLARRVSVSGTIAAVLGVEQSE
jgi:hypothetical protein